MYILGILLNTFDFNIYFIKIAKGPGKRVRLVIRAGISPGESDSGIRNEIRERESMHCKNSRNW